MGSIGQYDGVFETIENITARDIIFNGTLPAAYVKTWTGEQMGSPLNGGGGGIGCMFSPGFLQTPTTHPVSDIKNVKFENFTLHNIRISISQCTTC